MESLSTIKNQSWLSWFYRGVTFLGFLILFGRLADLQIIKGDYYKEISEGNRIRRVTILAPRGEVFTRGGELLIGNLPVKKRIVFDPEKGYTKSDFLENSSDDELVTEYVRSYKLGSSAGHVTGFLGLVNDEEVGKVRSECLDHGAYSNEDSVGRTGLEEYYECKLSGISGEELVEVDATGKKIRTLGRKEPIPGENISTNIDYYLQKKVAEIMTTDKDGNLIEQKGAVIITDARSEVLAIYSAPSFDPNDFVRGRSDAINSYFENKSLPLFNRAFGGVFHPGSIYKPIISIAALEEDVIDDNFTFVDEGIISLDTAYGSYSYANWYFTQYGGKEGEIDLEKALARSTDTFFYKIGEELGINKIVKWSEKFGLGQKTGIDLKGEVSGLVPSPDWKVRTKGEKWFLGNTYHMSIGQGDLNVTPLQMNVATGSLASNGQLCKPRIVGETDCIDLGIDQKNIDKVINGMVDACSTGGTAFTFFDSPLKVACKTGTAETGDGESTHAWFTFIAPAPVDEYKEKVPEIVVTVLVEKGGEGSKVAGPIARRIFDAWYEIKFKVQN